MLLNHIPPTVKLQSYIRFYRIIDFDFTNTIGGANQTKAYRPRIEHCLQFTPFGQECVDYQKNKEITYPVALFGQQTVLSYRKLDSRFLNFQVVFQPGVLNMLLKASIDQLTNVYCDASLFFGNCVFEVNEQLAACKSYPEMIEKVEAFLSRKIYQKQLNFHPINRIAQLLSLHGNTQSIEWFAGQSNLCYRQFNRVFKSNNGITPQEFRSLVNLDCAYLLKNRNPKRPWLGIALESGFHDYQHLARCYKKFTGYSPTAFYQLEQSAPERCFGDFEQ